MRGGGDYLMVKYGKITNGESRGGIRGCLNKEPIKGVSKQRSDGQKSGLAGEFCVAAELLKRGLQTSLTLGNAKSIDLFAINHKDTRFTIQVKALRSPNYFLIDLERVQDACYYVFAVLNKPDVPPDYYIVPGCDLQSNPAKFGNGLLTIKRCRGFIRKTSQNIATSGKFLTRNWESEQSQIALSNVPGLGVNVSESSRKKSSGLG